MVLTLSVRSTDPVLIEPCLSIIFLNALSLYNVTVDKRWCRERKSKLNRYGMHKLYARIISVSLVCIAFETAPRTPIYSGSFTTDFPIGLTITDWMGNSAWCHWEGDSESRATLGVAEFYNICKVSSVCDESTALCYSISSRVYRSLYWIV